jgi:hypothetical protein
VAYATRGHPRWPYLALSRLTRLRADGRTCTGGSGRASWAPSPRPKPRWPPSRPASPAAIGRRDRLARPGRGRHPGHLRSPDTTPRERKQLIRALLSEVTLTVDRQARTAALTLCWEGGAITDRTVALPRLGAPWRTTQASPWTSSAAWPRTTTTRPSRGCSPRQHRRTGTGLTFQGPNRRGAPQLPHPPVPQGCRAGLS